METLHISIPSVGSTPKMVIRGLKIIRKAYPATKQKKTFLDLPFMHGMELNRRFFYEVVGPLMALHFPNLKYAAGLIGHGSDVLGFDSPTSMDHNWGPHLVMVFQDKDFAYYKPKVDEMLRTKLPYEFMGYPTNFTKPNEDTYLVTQMKPKHRGKVDHMFDFHSKSSFFKHYLGIRPYKHLSLSDWLTFPQQGLLEVTIGELFHDTIGFAKLRKKFSYYPENVWLYLYEQQWVKLAQLQAKMQEQGEIHGRLRGNITATLIARDLVRQMMKLGYLLDKTYEPYVKWFGKCFELLPTGKEVYPLLLGVIRSKTGDEQALYLAKAYKKLAAAHNRLQVTKPINTEMFDIAIEASSINLSTISTFLNKKIRNPLVERIQYQIGGIDQFVDHARLNHLNYVYRRFKSIIR